MAKLLSYFDIPIELSPELRQELIELENRKEDHHLKSKKVYYTWKNEFNHWANANISPETDSAFSLLFESKNYIGHESSQLVDVIEQSISYPECVKQVIDMFQFKPNFWSFAKIPAGKVVPPHTDTVYNGGTSRRTVIIFPLEPYGKNYAPCDVVGYTYIKTKPIETIKFRPCYAFSTERYHSVKNNKYCRKSLQLWYSQPIEELHQLYNENKLIGSTS